VLAYPGCPVKQAVKRVSDCLLDTILFHLQQFTTNLFVFFVYLFTKNNKAAEGQEHVTATAYKTLAQIMREVVAQTNINTQQTYEEKQTI